MCSSSRDVPAVPPPTPVPMPLDPAIEAVRSRSRNKARLLKGHLSTILTKPQLGQPTILGGAGS